MPVQVTRHENESFEHLLRRFNRKIQQGRLLPLVRKRQFYQKPLTRRKKREIALRKKTRRELKRKKIMMS